MWNVTYKLLVIVMRLPFTKCAMLLTYCWRWANVDKVIFWATEPAWHAANPLCIFMGKDVIVSHCFSQNLQYHSQSVEQNHVSTSTCGQHHSLPFSMELVSWGVGKRKQCHWLSFVIMFHTMNPHVTEGSHTSCLFYNRLWRSVEKEKHLLSVVLGHEVMFIASR